jgi:hypothetical protein
VRGNPKSDSEGRKLPRRRHSIPIFPRWPSPRPRLRRQRSQHEEDQPVGLVEAWHRTLSRAQQPKAQWLPSGIQPFEFIEGSEKSHNLKVWTITELLSTKALVAEGRTMKHCVATYAHSCASGVCSIWTLEVETFEGRQGTDRRGAGRDEADLSGTGEVQHAPRRQALWHPAPLGRAGGPPVGEARVAGHQSSPVRLSRQPRGCHRRWYRLHRPQTARSRSGSPEAQGGKGRNHHNLGF